MSVGLGVALTSSPSTVTLPYTNPSDGVTVTSTCTGTDPQFLTHSGGAGIITYPGTTKFDVTYGGNGQVYADPYVNAGYNAGDWSGNCNKNKAGLSPAVPVQIGKQGSPVASIHTITGTSPSGYFYGDTGYDLWFTPNPSDNTYATMEGATGPYAVSTEVMIWTSNTNLVIGTTNPQYYPVMIDGLHWYVETGLAANGHGRCLTQAVKASVSPLTAESVATDKIAPRVCAAFGKGWNVVNFIAPTNHLGNVTMTNLALDPFISYTISHGWLPAHDWWEGVNAGFEITEGNASLAGFTLTGMN
jgi:hypothetical protein